MIQTKKDWKPWIEKFTITLMNTTATVKNKLQNSAGLTTEQIRKDKRTTNRQEPTNNE